MIYSRGKKFSLQSGQLYQGMSKVLTGIQPGQSVSTHQISDLLERPDLPHCARVLC